jgi:purine-binding chemotaxis protein CheW
VIAFQNQKILHQYFTDLLFQPLAAEVTETLMSEEVLKTKPEPLPNREARTEKTEPTSEAAAEVTTPVRLDENAGTSALGPWADYRWENQHPPWAQDNFDCLLFEVRGFNFAVPLITLGQIQMINDDLSPVFGQAPWFMGIQTTTMGTIRVVNTAQFVMPERYKPEVHYRPTYMVSIADCHWALAVDQVNQPVNLAPSDVKWRVNRERQVWLAGVVKKQMCVLIDIPALARQLMTSDKNNMKSPISRVMSLGTGD